MKLPDPDPPFVTQYEPNGLGGNNCGAACLTMLMAAAGLVEPTHEAMHQAADYIRDGIYNGNWNAGTYTDFPGMQDMLWREYRTASTILRDWSGVWARLDRGVPVILLVDNSVLQPRQYPATAAFNAHHFLVLTGWDATHYRVNDPLSLQKAAGEYTLQSVERGVQNVGGVYALALDVPVPVPVSEGNDMPVSAEDQAILDVVHGLGANAASITGWINLIGALEAQLAQLQQPTPVLEKVSRVTLEYPDGSIQTIDLPAGTEQV